MNYILRSNLMAALQLAIETATKAGQGETAQVAGWKDNLVALQAGETLWIRESI